MLYQAEPLPDVLISPGISIFYSTPADAANAGELGVTSSRLCKYAEGAVFPFQVESLEDGVDDSIHGLHINEADQ